MKKSLLICFALAVFAPISIIAQSTAADKAWAPFFKKFKTAVKARSKAKVKTLMGPENTWFDGGGGDSRDQWLNWISKQNLWNDILSGLNQGVKSCGRGCKTTRERGPVFEFKNGRWLFIQIMGD